MSSLFSSLLFPDILFTAPKHFHSAATLSLFLNIFIFSSKINLSFKKIFNTARKVLFFNIRRNSCKLKIIPQGWTLFFVLIKCFYWLIRWFLNLNINILYTLTISNQLLFYWMHTILYYVLLIQNMYDCTHVLYCTERETKEEDWTSWWYTIPLRSVKELVKRWLKLIVPIL